MDWLLTLVDVETGLLILGTAAIIRAVKMASMRVTSKWFKKARRIAWKLEYVWPLLIATTGALTLPGLFDDDKLGVKVLRGLLAGLGTHWAAKMIKRVFQDKPAEDKKDGEV